VSFFDSHFDSLACEGGPDPSRSIVASLRTGISEDEEEPCKPNVTGTCPELGISSSSDLRSVSTVLFMCFLDLKSS
jgi:hypothetical protein